MLISSIAIEEAVERVLLTLPLPFLPAVAARLLLAISYDLSVKVVNALEVEEWAYSSGIAVMRLSGGALAILDTRGKTLYLSKSYLLRDQARSSSRAARLKAILAGEPLFAMANFAIKMRLLYRQELVRAWRGAAPGAGKVRVEVLRGDAVIPSLRVKGGVAKGFGTFLRARLDERRIDNADSCLGALVKLLREGPLGLLRTPTLRQGA